MSNYQALKKKRTRSTICKPFQQEIKEAPDQFCDYIACCSGNRFEEICNIYLKGMTIDDVKYMKPEDLIDLVPIEQHRHKLLMSILVRRYIFPAEPIEPVCEADKNDAYENKCEYCEHSCTNSECTHSCDNY